MIKYNEEWIIFIWIIFKWLYDNLKQIMLFYNHKFILQQNILNSVLGNRRIPEMRSIPLAAKRDGQSTFRREQTHYDLIEDRRRHEDDWYLVPND